MMNRNVKRAVIFTILLCGVVYSSFSQVLWQNAEYGMTLSQVKGLFPKATEPTEKSTTGPKERQIVELLRLPNYEVSGTNFNVAFYFYNNKLEQITLRCADKLTLYEGQLAFQSISNALTSKYGNPVSLDKRDGFTGPDWMAIWVSGKLNIVMLCSGYDKDNTTSIFNIVYQVRISQEADKL
jgi:hypothetical protein